MRNSKDGDRADGIPTDVLDNVRDAICGSVNGFSDHHQAESFFAGGEGGDVRSQPTGNDKTALFLDATIDKNMLENGQVATVQEKRTDEQPIKFGGGWQKYLPFNLKTIGIASIFIIIAITVVNSLTNSETSVSFSFININL